MNRHGKELSLRVVPRRVEDNLLIFKKKKE